MCYNEWNDDSMIFKYKGQTIHKTIKVVEGMAVFKCAIFKLSTLFTIGAWVMGKLSWHVSLKVLCWHTQKLIICREDCSGEKYPQIMCQLSS